MGSVIQTIKICVKWVGDIYNKYIKWFKNYMSLVNKKTEKFLIKNIEEIQNCEEPSKIGQYLAAKHEANQIQEIADKIGEDLSPADMSAAKEILNKNCFIDDFEISSNCSVDSISSINSTNIKDSDN